METKQLSAFCAVVERRSFSQAAERLGVTQPAVSLQVRSLEQRLGQKLLDRSGRRVEPTEAGMRLYHGAQRLLQLEEQLVADVAGNHDAAVTGTLAIGASTGPGGTVVPLLLCQFQQSHPDVRVDLQISDTQHVIARVADRALELGIVGASPRRRGVVFEPFFRDRVVLATLPGHRFAGRTVSLDELREEPLIVMQEGAGVRQVIEDELRRAGTRLRDLDVRLELGLQESVKSAVVAGHGVTFISSSAIEAELTAGTLAAAHVEGLEPVREIALVRASGRSPTRAAEAFVAFAREELARVIVRWGLDELAALLDEVGVERPLLVASERWRPSELPVPRSAVWTEVPSDRVADAVVAAEGADGILALGGGSAIDLGKAISVASGLPLVSVPTTYAGAEWTRYFGVRDPGRRIRGGGGGAHLAGALYEPQLTLSLPRAETVGTAMNALAHCAEALYVLGHNSEADGHALTGARLISEWLPRVVETLDDLEARTRLLEGAVHAGAALGKSMLALGHAMAQAVGGHYGIPHGAANAVCLPSALRFNAEVAPDALARLGEALGGDPVERVRELALLGGYERLRDLGVLEEDLTELAEAASQRNGAKMNPRPASPAQIEQLLRSVY